MDLTKSVINGLRIMAAAADAGGPADIGLDEAGKAGSRAWYCVQTAIDWVRGLGDGRRVALVLTPSQAVCLVALAERGWIDTGRGLGMTAAQGRMCRQALRDAYAQLPEDLRHPAGAPIADVVPPTRPSLKPSRDRQQWEQERRRVEHLPEGPLCSMCVEVHVAEIGDICAVCRRTWSGADVRPAKAGVDTAIE